MTSCIRRIALVIVFVVVSVNLTASVIDSLVSIPADSSASHSGVSVRMPFNKVDTSFLSWEKDPSVKFFNDKYDRVMMSFYKNSDKNRFNPYLKDEYWPSGYLTMIHSFYLKFKVPAYKNIKYEPCFLSTHFLPDLNKGLGVLNHIDTKIPVFNNQPSQILAIMDSFVIHKPMYVRYHWDQIPSPHRFILDGVLLDKKAAKEALRLSKVEIKKLDKPKSISQRWIYEGVESLQLSQSYFSNWVKGGLNTIALLSDLRVSTKYKYKKIEWDSKGIHKLGIISSEGERSRINDDLIQLTSKAGLNASKKWYYSMLFDFKSQFFYGREKKEPYTIVSGFMSPAYLTFAIGMDYKMKDFTLLLSPYTSKMTLVLDTTHVNISRYDIPAGRKSNSNSGASVYNSFKWRINTEFTLTSNFDLFYGYLNRDPETQMDWELIFDMRINKYLSSRINLNFRYFESESLKVQLKENFSIVFSYKFS
jgi:hypothetical protein